MTNLSPFTFIILYARNILNFDWFPYTIFTTELSRFNQKQMVLLSRRSYMCFIITVQGMAEWINKSRAMLKSNRVCNNTLGVGFILAALKKKKELTTSFLAKCRKLLTLAGSSRISTGA